MQEENARTRDRVLDDQQRQNFYREAERRADAWLQESADPVASTNEVALYLLLIIGFCVLLLIITALGG